MSYIASARTRPTTEFHSYAGVNPYDIFTPIRANEDTYFKANLHNFINDSIKKEKKHEGTSKNFLVYGLN